MADNYGNSTTSAGTLPIGGQITSDIEVNGDADWFRVALTGGTTYRFDLRANSPILKLFDTSGTQLKSQNLAVDGVASITFTPLTSGTYYVGAHTRRAEFGYTVQAAVAPFQDDFRDDIATTGMVAVGGQVTGTIEATGDQDWIGVALQGGTTYVFNLRGVAGEEWTRDSLVVRLFDADGTDLRVVGARTDANGDASMVFTPLTSGKYHLVVRRDGSTADGAYTLQAAVAAIQDDFRNDIASTGAVAIGGQTTGSIEAIGDTDWFKVQLDAGRTYQFELLGANGGGSLQHPGLQVLNPDAAFLGPLSRGGTDTNLVYSYTALVSGTHYLAASDGEGTGTYTLRASLDPYPRSYLGGDAGNDVFILGGAGTAAVIDGGSGIDTVQVSGQFSDYVVMKDGGVIVVTPAGQQSDFLYGVERVQFSDRGLAFDIGTDGNAANVLRAIGVIYGTGSFGNSALIGQSLALFDQGMSFEAFMQRSLDTVLGAEATSEEIVTLMYKNVAGRDPSVQDLEYYAALLDDGIFTPSELGVYASNTIENHLNVTVLGIGVKGTSVVYTDYML